MSAAGPSQPWQLRARAERWLGRSIANRVALLGTALAAVFVVFAGTASFLITRAFVMDGARATVAARASLLAERVQGTLRAVDDDIGGLARSSLVARGLVDPSGRSAYLRPFLRDHAMPAGSAHHLGLANAHGRVIVSNDGASPTYGERTWWSSLVEGAPRHAEVTLEPEPALVLAYPVILPATGQPEGGLVLELPLRRVLEWSARDLPPEYAADFLVQGHRVAPFSRSRLGGGSPGPALLEARAPVDSPWEGVGGALEVNVSTPPDRALQLLWWLGLTHALGGATALVLAGWAASRSSRWLLGPMIQISRSAEAIARGGAGGEVRFEGQGEDEPAQLNRALQHMLERLRQAQDGLEVRVAERTAELELAESRLRAILDHMLDGLVTLDEENRIESFSRGAERIFGWRAEEVVGEDIGVLMPAAQAAAHAGHLRRYLATGVAHIIGVGREVEAMRRDGTRFPMELQVTELHHRGRRLFVGIVRDITERRKVERLKNEFVSVVSHELRTPLTSIRGALGLVVGGIAGAVPETADRLLRIALENGIRLTRLIDDLLDVQRMEAGAMRLALVPTALDGLIAQAAELNQSFAAGLQLEIAVQGAAPRVHVSVDPSRFQQVMANLLSNACKFSPPGAVVELEGRLDAGRVRIEVRDRGPGIPPEFRERLFQKFSQADSSASRSGAGTGLGLAITKGLVEGMGGAIGFEPRDGGGTTFFVELPVHAPPTAAAG